MQSTLDAHPTLDTDTPPARARGRWRLAAATAAAIAAVVAGAVVLQPGTGPSAEAAVATAAERLAEVASLRADVHVEDDDEISDITVAASGDDRQIVQQVRARDTAETVVNRWTVVDGDEYLTQVFDGEDPVTFGPLTPSEGPAPFGEASAAVIEAALGGADVDEIGTEEIRGVETTHYRVRLAEPGRSALADLPADQREWWFGLIFDDDHLADDVTLDIWTADDTIRRLALSSANGTATTDYYDFGADITITPPPPPYIDPTD